MVRKALRAGVADVKVIRGAEVGSDHYLVLMKLKLKIRKQREPEKKSIEQKLFALVYFNTVELAQY